MKYILMMTTSSTPAEGVPPMHEWSPEDAQASGQHMMRIHQELVERGELLGAEALAGPEAARIVVGARTTSLAERAHLLTRASRLGVGSP